jgi:hypothetical protein
MAGLSHEMWLREAVQELQDSASPVDRLASLGMIVRLWMPTSRAERRALLFGETKDPCALIVAFLGGIDAETLKGLDELSEATASGLVSDARRDDLLSDPSQMRLLMHQRDVLESALVVLEHCRHGKGLRQVLAFVDQHMRDGADVEADDWLAAVFANDPYSWWGRI